MARRTPSLRHKITDRDRIDWLEAMANRKGGLLLHNGTESGRTGRTGLGLRPGLIKARTLRQAIDAAFQRSDIPPKEAEASTILTTKINGETRTIEMDGVIASFPTGTKIQK